MDYRLRALEVKDGKTWEETAKIINTEYGMNKTGEQLRGSVKNSKFYKQKDNREIKKEITDGQILSALKTKRTPQQDADILHMDIETFKSHVKRISDLGYNIQCENGLIWLERSLISSNNILNENYSGETTIKFGLISDTHLCNKKQQLTYLNDFYNHCQNNGVNTVYHAGDISDGFYKNRQAHIYEIFCAGVDEQAEYIIKNYPKRKGIKTKFITGNHDATHVMNGGSDIGKMISREREDMEYLGYMKAKVWITPQCDLDLFHPLDGGSYAISYQPQKHIDGLQGGSKPRIMAFGHYHKQFITLYRNIHVFVVPCFEAQTTFEIGKHLHAVVGGYIVTVKCKPDGTVKSVTPEFIPYYDMIENDY